MILRCVPGNQGMIASNEEADKIAIREFGTYSTAQSESVEIDLGYTSRHLPSREQQLDHHGVVHRCV